MLMPKRMKILYTKEGFEILSAISSEGEGNPADIYYVLVNVLHDDRPIISNIQT